MAVTIEELGLNPQQCQTALAALADLVRYGRKLAADGLVTGTAGNLSVRVGELVLITPTSVDYDVIGEDDICVMDAEGQQVVGNGRPSSEYPMHRKIYDAVGGDAIVHTHSMAAVVASVTCDEIPAVHYAIHRLGGSTVRVAPYRRFGSDALARSAVRALEDRSAALLQNHGAIAYGSTLQEAYMRAELLEWLAELWNRSRQVGGPKVLTDAEVAEVAEEALRRRYAQVAR